MVISHSFLFFSSCCLLRWLAAPCCLSTTARDGPKSGWSILVKRLLSLREKSWHTGRCGWRATERTGTSLDWIVWWTSLHPWWTVSLEVSEPPAEISLSFGKEQHYLVRVCGEIYQGHSVCVQRASRPCFPPSNLLLKSQSEKHRQTVAFKER